jgi:chaperonin GroES
MSANRKDNNNNKYFKGGFLVIRPLGERVVVKPLPSEEVTKSGIVLPDTAKEKPQEGEVVAVGSGRLLDNGSKVAIDLKVGDKVLFSKYAGNEVKINEVEYLILREADVLGVIE